jgi:hypothetical protein
MSGLDEEKSTVLGILFGLISIAIIFYGFALHVNDKQQKLATATFIELQKIAAPASAAPKASLPPEPLPEEQTRARNAHMELALRSLDTRLKDVETYFVAKELAEGRQRLTQGWANGQQEEYLECLERRRMLQDLDPLLPAPVDRGQ